jgi:hypothetical protein
MAGEATISIRQRSEIYEINKLLREGEQERFQNFMNNKASPQCNTGDISTSHSYGDGDDSDSDNSCFENAGCRKRLSAKSSRSKSLSAVTAIAASYRSQSNEIKIFRAKKNTPTTPSNFGAV